MNPLDNLICGENSLKNQQLGNMFTMILPNCLAQWERWYNNVVNGGVLKIIKTVGK